MELIAETEPQRVQAPEPVKPLSHAKQELAVALKKFNDEKSERESNETRLADARKEEQRLLEVSMDEEEQVAKIATVVARQRLLEAKLLQGKSRLETAHATLRHAAVQGLRSFDFALAELRDERNAKNMGRLKEMVGEQAWPLAETPARIFAAHIADVKRIDLLGHQSRLMLQGPGTRQAAENLLIDIAELEAERAGKR
jgi:hypothetical protein